MSSKCFVCRPFRSICFVVKRLENRSVPLKPFHTFETVSNIFRRVCSNCFEPFGIDTILCVSCSKHFLRFVLRPFRAFSLLRGSKRFMVKPLHTLQTASRCLVLRQFRTFHVQNVATRTFRAETVSKVSCWDRVKRFALKRWNRFENASCQGWNRFENFRPFRTLGVETLSKLLFLGEAVRIVSRRERLVRCTFETLCFDHFVRIKFKPFHIFLLRPLRKF